MSQKKEALDKFMQRSKAFAKGFSAYTEQEMEHTPLSEPISDNCSWEDLSEAQSEAPDTSIIMTQNTFIGYGINVINGTSFSSASRSPLLDLKVYQNSSEPIIISSNYPYGEYTGTAQKELHQMYNNLNVNCSISSGKAVPFFSGGVESMYGSKTEVQSEAQFFRAIYSITSQKHILKPELLFPKWLRTKLSPEVSEILNSTEYTPEDIFANLGTHMILSHSIGGNLNVTGIYNSTESVTSHDLEVAVNAACSYVKAEAKTSLSDAQKKIGQKSTIRIKATGGDVSTIGGASFEMLGTTIHDWGKTVTKNPELQTIAFIYQYMPLWELATDAKRRKELEDSFELLAAKRCNALSEYFTRAEKPRAASPMLPGSNYILRNVHANFVLDVPGNQLKKQQMILYPCHKHKNQQFTVSISPHNKYSVVVCSALNNSWVLDVWQNQAKENQPVYLHPRNGTDAQYFTPRLNADGTFTLLFARDNSFAIDTASSIHEHHANLVLKKVSSSTTQKWRAEICK